MVVLLLSSQTCPVPSRRSPTIHSVFARNMARASSSGSSHSPRMQRTVTRKRSAFVVVTLCKFLGQVNRVNRVRRVNLQQILEVGEWALCKCEASRVLVVIPTGPSCICIWSHNLGWEHLYLCQVSKCPTESHKAKFAQQALGSFLSGSKTETVLKQRQSPGTSQLQPRMIPRKWSGFFLVIYIYISLSLSLSWYIHWASPSTVLSRFGCLECRSVWRCCSWIPRASRPWRRAFLMPLTPPKPRALESAQEKPQNALGEPQRYFSKIYSRSIPCQWIMCIPSEICCCWHIFLVPQRYMSNSCILQYIVKARGGQSAQWYASCGLGRLARREPSVCPRCDPPNRLAAACHPHLVWRHQDDHRRKVAPPNLPRTLRAK